MKLGYVRVSTVEQNEKRQLEALSGCGIEKWYVEKVSGKNLDRPKLGELIDFAREGDTVYVLDWSRLSRSTKDLLELVDRFRAKGVHLVSLKENFDTSTPAGRLMITFMAAINEFERTNMLERQKEGISIAKREGRYKGRKPASLQDPAAVYNAYITRQKPMAALARENGLSRPTLLKLLKAYEKEFILTNAD